MMLCDPKWGPKPDIYALPTLIAWLETMPADATYDYAAPDRCAVAQYLKHHGESKYALYNFELSDKFGMEVCDALYADGAHNLQTFGAALNRLSALL